MNIKAIIASLVLGSSSVAMASPSVTFSASAHGSYGTTVVRDHRYDGYTPMPAPVRFPAPAPAPSQSYWRGERMPPVYRPVTLASDMHFGNDGRSFITVGAQQGLFQTLQITGCEGRTLINQVYVEFDNGQEQMIRGLNRTLVGNQTLTLDLDGSRRVVKRVIVYGNAISSGWRGPAGTFTVTAA